MANIASQKKRNRQNVVRRSRNRRVNSQIKTLVKRTEAAAEAGESTDELYRATQKRIDSAVSKGILHPNTAARTKSRLAARIS